VPANTGLTSASAGKLFKPSGYLLSLALVYYNTRNQLVKEYIEEGRQASIIVVNLSISDTEEADKLAFNANREQYEQKA
jgi:hypothetical protein